MRYNRKNHPTMPLSTGTRLGPYTISSFIGAGGMGEVYRARDTRLNRDVAIKVLPPSFAEESDRLRRFKLEAQAASALNHPNILTVYDIGTDETSPYLVSELLEGESLRDRLRKGKLSVPKVVDYARQAAAGLAAAHAKGITHRDFKPDNLYITKDGRVKILDFGLAKVSSTSQAEVTGTMTAATSAGTVMGTAAYMSPEQARGQAVDQRSDIFSFGCVLYEMLTGERAFEGDTAADLLSAILAREPDLGAIEPPNMRRLISHCLEKSPDERFQSARDIAFGLEAVTLQESGPKQAVEVAPKRNRTVRALAAACAVLAAVCATLVYLYFSPAPQKTFQRLTFRRGIIHAARFTPDGNGVVYSAKWEDEPSEVFTARFESPGSRALGFPNTQLLSISSTGELALAQNVRIMANSFAPAGMVARAPFSGGAARAIDDRIDFADWSPDGKEMLLVRESDKATQLEFPPGNVLYKTAGYISEPRLSPTGDQIAFIDHPLTNDNRGSVAIVDRAGQKKTLASEFLAVQGLAWSAKGDEIWFTAAKTGARFELRAVTPGGRERVVLSQSVAMVLHDISRDGRVLLSNLEMRVKLMFRGAADTEDRELSWLDWSLIRNLSPDGRLVTFSESGEGAGADQVSYLRETNGKPAVLLGPGASPVFSPDGQSVVDLEPDSHAIVIYPVGPGQSKRIPMQGYTISGVGWMPDGKRIWFTANEPSHARRGYLTDVAGAKPRPLTPEGAGIVGLVLNGKYLTSVAAEKMRLFPTDGGDPVTPEGIRERERIVGWSQDGQGLFVAAREEVPAKVYRLDVKTGRREFMREVSPADRAGVFGGVAGLTITSDGKTYAYSIQQNLDELHVVSGLK